MGELANDPTKTRWYVTVDLLIKAISAAGIIIIGVIGILFAKKDRAERGLLPMLESLSELQLAAASVATTLRTSGGPLEVDSKLRRQGLRISYLADSLVMAEGERNINVSPSEDFAKLGKRSRSLVLSLRCSAIMLGELSEVASQIEKANSVAVDKNLHVLKLSQSVPEAKAGQPRILASNQSLPIDSRSEPCWTLWLGPREVNSKVLRADSIAGLAGEVEKGTADIIYDVLNRHPDVADKYVELQS